MTESKRVPRRSKVAAPKSFAAEDRRRTEAAREKLQNRRKQGTSPGHSLAAYAAHYVHPAYGELEVRLDAGRLHLLRGKRVFALEHWHDEVFSFESGLIADPQLIRFQTDPDGDVHQLLWRLEPAVGEIVFSKRK